MGKALYRTYRSRSLDEVVGQDHVTSLLKRAIAQNKVAHAYLFTGPRGVGKTSIARILAHEINQLPYTEESTHLDIIEIDAASNNGVDDIRDLRDRVQIAPVSAAKKVYIIDEVHMLSKPAFNALLKTLEEPPEHVVFILATTDIDKVPETIISRTQRHTFRRARTNDIVLNLQRIAQKEKLTVENDALELIALHADGSFRDSVSLFDQLVSGAEAGTVTVADVTRSLGLAESEQITTLIEATFSGSVADIYAILGQFEQAGIPARTTTAQLTEHLRQIIAERPEALRLIDLLLEVSRSQYPDYKLLTTLGLFSPQAESQPSQSMPVSTPQQTAAPKATPTKPVVPNQPAAPTSAAPSMPNNASVKADTPPSTTKPARPAASQPTDFDWAKLLAHVRTHHVAIHSVLSKCEPELDGDTLRLYTKSAFYKKKLDDPKYKGLLVSSLTELGFDLLIETLPGAKPLSDDQAAKVAAIMGGGEEVSVDDA